MATDVRDVIADSLSSYDRSLSSYDRAGAVLAALAGHGVELVADLPPVTVTAWDKERLLAGWLAIARHLETRDTEPDPADVDALTSLLAGAYQAALSDPRDLARVLLLAGVRLPDGGAA
jgi:hypothetical protein